MHAPNCIVDSLRRRYKMVIQLKTYFIARTQFYSTEKPVYSVANWMNTRKAHQMPCFRSITQFFLVFLHETWKHHKLFSFDRQWMLSYDHIVFVFSSTKTRKFHRDSAATIHSMVKWSESVSLIIWNENGLILSCNRYTNSNCLFYANHTICTWAESILWRTGPVTKNIVENVISEK